MNIIIAVGHSGFEVDKSIAREVEDVDLVVGAHSNTFLYSGVKPSNEDPAGPYPTIVAQAGGKEVPVVQAYWCTKYLGYLKFNISENGRIDTTTITGAPILLNYTYKQGTPSSIEM